ncbi:hypothetical protein FB566_2139 [Stackebrandtia endophytica]|uniref:Uncharacterized protein n=1 Tax=Stackebrandtia endophytica TaxID=1496996 RepID=A0A543AVJ8_9ACTN|nr:hypothetical protein [Stackebrandtia endophytica]TQL76606.1 hypothetical protein FB566_2139 [Stackebrandtia endophytica]
MTDSSSTFRFRATGTPETDTYITRGPRGTRAEFSGFRDGELLYAVPDQAWADLDDDQASERWRFFLTRALNQIWASSGNRIAWLFESPADADALRDGVAELVEQCRGDFPDAAIAFRVVESPASPLDATSVNPIASVASKPAADLRLIALGRPIGFMDETRQQFLLEFCGHPIALGPTAARLWLTLRTEPAATGRLLTTTDVERIDGRGGESVVETLTQLRTRGLIAEWANDDDAVTALARLRALPLQSFGSDADGSSIVAIAGRATGDDLVTTPVSNRERTLITLGPLCDDLAETAESAWRREELSETDIPAALTGLARELPRLLARDVVYLDAAAKDCVPERIVDASPLDVEVVPATDLGFLALGLVVDATAGRPTRIRLRGRLEPLDANEGRLWQIVCELNPYRGPNGSESQELHGVARSHRIRNVEVTLDRLIRRGLIRHLRGSLALRSLSALCFRPLMAGLNSSTHRPSGTEPKRQWLLGTTHDQRALARTDDVGRAFWASTGAELPSLQHAVSLLVHRPDLGEVSFALGCMRSLVADGAGYLDAIGEHSGHNVMEGARP